mmetsp:Transcript_29734/g.62070  ORF Transcript_29734/g.62070 Transcript_29734/m.62070 type:complete len:127 (-) Transcript_29734:1300-1680(-)
MSIVMILTFLRNSTFMSTCTVNTRGFVGNSTSTSTGTLNRGFVGNSTSIPRRSNSTGVHLCRGKSKIVLQKTHGANHCHCFHYSTKDVISADQFCHRKKTGGRKRNDNYSADWMKNLAGTYGKKKN